MCLKKLSVIMFTKNETNNWKKSIYSYIYVHNIMLIWLMNFTSYHTNTRIAKI